jgi:hypothetical protein
MSEDGVILDDSSQLALFYIFQLFHYRWRDQLDHVYLPRMFRKGKLCIAKGGACHAD